MAVSTSTATVFQPQFQQRALVGCLAASLALHTAALLGFPELRSSAPDAPKVLTALLAFPAVRQEAAAPARAEPPRGKPKPREVARTDPQPALPEPAVEPAPAPEQSASAAPQAPAEAAPSPAPVVGELASKSVPVPVAEGSGLQDYKSELIGFANKMYRDRYPILAREKGWVGKVQIVLTVRPSGAIESARIVTPSGYQILDDFALTVVKHAQARTSIPPALRGREFSIELPLKFGLTGSG